MAGRKMKVALVYRDWASSVPGSSAAEHVANGRIPYITWEPWYWSGATAPTLDAIASGAEDAKIRAAAQGVKSFGHRVFFRFAHEMNGNWYPWDGYHNGRDPSKYVRAYRRVVDVFRAEGVTNAAFVWTPNWESVPRESWNDFRNYYPGDAYVDWVGSDGYNRYLASWKPLAAIFDCDQSAASTRCANVYRAYPHKPYMIGETSSIEDPNDPTRKARWIDEGRAYIKASMPNLKAFVWFHRGPKSSESIDWRINTSQPALDAFRQFAADPFFNP